MTSNYEGPAFKKGHHLAGNKKRKFHPNLGSHRSSGHALEEPALKKAKKKIAPPVKPDKLSNRHFVSNSRSFEKDPNKPHSSSYQTIFTPSTSRKQVRLAKANQAMRSRKSVDEQFENESNEITLPLIYDIPFLHKNEYRRIKMENTLQKDYNNSLPTRERKHLKESNQTIGERLANIDHSLRAVQRMQAGNQERWSMGEVDRRILKRLVKEKQSFLLFTKEDNE